MAEADCLKVWLDRDGGWWPRRAPLGAGEAFVTDGPGIDRASAHEAIKARVEATMADETAAKEQAASMARTAKDQAGAAADDDGGLLGSLGGLLGGGKSGRRMSAGEQLFKSAASAIGSEVGRQIIRGVLGGIFGSKRR